jgi:hypothetical protein
MSRFFFWPRKEALGGKQAGARLQGKAFPVKPKTKKETIVTRNLNPIGKYMI